MKKFTLKFILVLIPIYIVVIYYEFYVVPNFSGDLGYLGKIQFGKEYMIPIEKNYLKNSRVDTFSTIQNHQYKIATSGDSFSQQNIYGYQNYLSNLENKNILNFKRVWSSLSPEQIAINHLKSGDLKKTNTKIVIVECAEKSFIGRLNSLEFDSIVIEPKIALGKIKEKSLIEKVAEWIRVSIWDINKRVVIKADLNDYYFEDTIRGNKLYYYNEDLLFRAVKLNEIKQAKINLIKMKRLFESSGIKFIYLVAADKYNVYQSFIKNNKYPNNTIMEHFKEFEKMKFFINTNIILIPMVNNGIKDVYMMNDSHWSYKGSEAVAKELHNRIKLLEIEN
ncbi:MAG: hypothetical protein WCG08_13700 [Paludibacter sp.]